MARLPFSSAQNLNCPTRIAKSNGAIGRPQIYPELLAVLDTVCGENAYVRHDAVSFAAVGDQMDHVFPKSWGDGDSLGWFIFSIAMVPR